MSPADSSRHAGSDAETSLLEFVFGTEYEKRALLEYSTEARSIARSRLRKANLKWMDPDELIGDALATGLRTVRRNPDTPIPNPAAHFHTLCRRRVADWFENQDFMNLADKDTDPFDDERRPSDLTWGHMDGVPRADSDVDDRWVREYRAAAEALGQKPESVSGVLTWLLLDLDEGIVIDDEFFPKTGVEAERRNRWPALWFATRKNAAAKTASARRARQREMARIERLREEVHEHMAARRDESGAA